MYDETGEPRFRPCPLLKRLTRAGLLGTKSGRGFFSYDADGSRTDRLPDDKPGMS
jgi:3-hydroxybutyryl-CoA dehydrogenase